MVLLLLFLAIPLIEIALFITVGGWLTLWPTLALVLATGIAGTFLVRWQGMAVLADLQRSQAVLQDPFSPLAHGALILVAGLLLITPGFFTDMLGFLLLVPPLRRALIRRMARHVGMVFPQAQGPRRDAPIDGEYIDLDATHEPHTPR
jgi:UPF0716 protein FxsA